MKHKRGEVPETGAQTATFIGILIAIIIFYILFLPPSERDKLLNEKTDEHGNSIVNEGENVTLLAEKIGRLDYLKMDEYEHKIPSFTLYRTTNSDVLKKFNPFYVKNGWFDKKSYNATFTLEQIEETSNVLLSFIATKYIGMLSIYLNGNNIYEGELSGSNVEPITLDKSMLAKENSLSFSVSGVGFRFWTTNEYAIQNIQLTGDITDISRQESKNIFYATEAEVVNLEKTTMEYNPECNLNEVGVLDIAVNGRNVFNGVPDCGILNTIEFSPDYIYSGSNKVVFKTAKGSYLIDQITVNTKLKEKITPVYYFDVNASVYKSLQKGNLSAYLKIDFVDDGTSKKLDISVNGGKIEKRIDQTKPYYERDISSRLEEGNNYIELIPKSVLNIVELRVEIFEKD
jgi:hypothetical protein